MKEFHCFFKFNKLSLSEVLQIKQGELMFKRRFLVFVVAFTFAISSLFSFPVSSTSAKENGVNKTEQTSKGKKNKSKNKSKTVSKKKSSGKKTTAKKKTSKKKTSKKNTSKKKTSGKKTSKKNVKKSSKKNSRAIQKNCKCNCNPISKISKPIIPTSCIAFISSLILLVSIYPFSHQ